MKPRISTAVLGLALMLAGCGGDAPGGSKSGGSGTPVAAVPAPNGGDWSQTVVQTPEGGFMMGNPNAGVKLVEFASMTCPHCAEFSEASPALIDTYVKTGRVSYELRNYVRDPIDLAASLLARCSGPGPFFKLTDQIFASQKEFFDKLQAMSPAEQQQLQALPPQQVVPLIAQKTGLVQFVQMRGVPADKAQQCLSDQKAVEGLVQMTNKANEFQLPGTPSFLINGRLVDNAADWSALEPKLKEAVGG
ncbi:MAG TPA: thioredoxin domain-containing protein [Allosphingosinicella sp.]|nr:thioredoxin domain-containing protein [Allosphingosinicella sp.]